MSKQVSIKANDPILNSLKFKAYRNIVERRVEEFSPKPGEKQTMEVPTPWGETLTAEVGDFIVSEVDDPKDRWPVRRDIFKATYKITRPGFCSKQDIVQLVPMIDLTDGDEDAQVIVTSLEGTNTVRAGDFFLARGSKGEVWSFPKQKAAEVLVPVNE